MSIPFKCPSCGGDRFSVKSEPKSYADLIGATCPTCGHIVTDEDIKGKARELVSELIEKALKRKGL
jgi:uncharacterized Zn finger protein